MKRIFSVALLSLALVSCGEQQTEAQVGQYTFIEVDEVYDAGTAAKGEIVTADIKIKNVGDYPLVIANIKASCSCTVSDYDENPIPPGETTIIRATVDTDRTGSGRVNKPISITANTKPSTTTVSILVNVIN